MESKSEEFNYRVSHVGQAHNKTPSTNRQIKSGMFTMLFEYPENAAELYYALTGTKCCPSEIKIMTITTVISGESKNDLAFMVGDKVLFAGEHQSTPSKNLPIRMLMYLGELYERVIKDKKNKEEDFLYSTTLLKLPKPEFAVFYNGTTKRPELEILKLSEAFEEIDDYDNQTKNNEPENNELGLLKLEIPVYNINKGMNTELFKKGEKLRQYSEFVAALRENQKSHKDSKEAVKITVDYCIDNGILEDFLRKNGGKLVSILATEYNHETAKRIYARDYALSYAQEKVGEELAESARQMLHDGMSIDLVAKYSRLPLDIIEKIQQSIFVNNP